MPTISLKLVMAAIIVTVAAVTAIVAFVPTYLSGMDSVRNNVDTIRAGILKNIAQEVKEYFYVPVPIVQSLQRSIHRGLLDPRNSSVMLEATIEQSLMIPHTSRLSLYVAQKDFSFALSEITNDGIHYAGAKSGCCGGPTNDVDGCCPLMLGALFPTPQKNVIRYDPTNRFAYIPTNLIGIAAPGLPGGSWYEAISRTVIGHAAWTKVTIAPPNSLRLNFAATLFSPSGEWLGVATSPVDANKVTDMLRALELTKNSRALMYVSGKDITTMPSYTTQSMFDAQNSEPGTVIGVSWHTETPILYTGLPSPNPLFYDQLLLTRDISNFTDPLIREVYAELGRTMLLNRTTPFTETVGSGRGKVFVDVNHIRDQYGLDLRYFVAMPEEDFLEEIYAQQTKTIVGVVCAVVGLCLISVVITVVVLSALDRIAFRMALCAQLADEEEPDSLSVISEMRAMQESYELMRSELNRIKVFLPSAVRAGAEEEEDEGVAIEDDLSSVSSSRHSSLASPHTLRKSKFKSMAAGRKSTYEVGAAVAPKLNIASGMLSKAVTVVCINIRGFHDTMAGIDGADWLQKAHRELVDAIHTAVTDHKGVIDSFNGDHFIATFNATRPCAQHAKNAAIAVCHLLQKIKDASPTFNALSIGVASGKATVGNLGNATMQRFCIMGGVYSQAVALEAMTAAYGTPVLANAEATREIQLAVYYEYVDHVKLAHAKKEGFLSTFSQLRTAKEEEWMYQIEESAASDPYGEANRAFQLYHEGDKDAAREVISTLKSKDLYDKFIGLPFLEPKLEQA